MPETSSASARLMIRQNGGQALSQHGLARPGRADEQKVVPAGRGDLHGALDILLPHDIPEDPAVSRSSGRGTQGAAAGEGALCPFRCDTSARHVRNAVDRQPLRQRGLGGVVRRDKQRADAGAPGGQRHGQHTGARPAARR